MSSNNANDYSLLERIPDSQLEVQPLPAFVRHRKTVLPTYRFRRLPSTIEELKELPGLWPIWHAKNETLILTDEPTVHGTGVLVYHDDSASSCIRSVLLMDNRCFWFSSGSFRCTIIGKSDYAIAETAAFLWSIDTDPSFREIRCWNEHFDFGVVSIDQLSLLIRKGPIKRITLRASTIRPAQSEFLAQIPYPTSLILEESFDSFLDGGHAFVEALSQRDQSFGSLKLWKVDETQNDTFQRLLQAKAVDRLELGCATLRQIRQLLSASVKGVGFTMKVDELVNLDWSRVDIVPKELSVEFSRYESETHVDMIVSFFRRVAELGDFVKLEVATYRELNTLMPNRVVDELCHAVIANQNLVELHLHHAFIQHAEHCKHLFAAMEHHEGLRRFISDMTPDYRVLTQLLKRNRFIEVLDSNGYRVTDDGRIDQLYTFNRFFCNSKGLIQESLSRVPSLVGYALTCSASSDFQRCALLLVNHTDALCELVLYSSLFFSKTHTLDASDDYSPAVG